MPNASMCLWCNHSYIAHSPNSDKNCPVGNAFDSSKRFVLQGDMTLSAFPIGTCISYYTNNSNGLIENPKDTRSEDHGIATIRALINPALVMSMYGNDSILLAWDAAAIHVPYGAWDVHTSIPEYVQLMTPTDAYGFWADKNTPVKQVVFISTAGGIVAQQMQKPKGGMHCAKTDCRAFNNYAEPNMADGTYICFSCRKRGY